MLGLLISSHLPTACLDEHVLRTFCSALCIDFASTLICPEIEVSFNKTQKSLGMRGHWPLTFEEKLLTDHL